jgi:hypothetical protein
VGETWAQRAAYEHPEPPTAVHGKISLELSLGSSGALPLVVAGPGFELGRLSRRFTGSRQALPKMLSTCRDVVIGVTCQPLNHSSTTSVGNRLAAAGHDRSCGPGLAGGGNTRGAADSKAPRGIVNIVLARLKPAWHCRSARTGRSQRLASSSISCRTDRLCWTAARQRSCGGFSEYIWRGQFRR